MHANKKEVFQANYGSSHVVLAQQWSDLHSTPLNAARLKKRERSVRGFKMFMMVHYFLWNHPKNCTLLSCRFDFCKKYCSGKRLWMWIEKITALKEEKIVWDDYLDNPNSEIIIISVDCADKRKYEPSNHPFYSRNKAEILHKHKHIASKFEIALALFKQQIAFISSPHRGGMHDITVLGKV
jgi:hypothetical protein